MKKQSSIEWFEQRIKEMFLPLSQEEALLKDIQQAKQMHKEETVDTFHMGMIKHSLMELNDELPKSFDDLDKIEPFKEGNEYYKTTYEK